MANLPARAKPAPSGAVASPVGGRPPGRLAPGPPLAPTPLVRDLQSCQSRCPGFARGAIASTPGKIESIDDGDVSDGRQRTRSHAEDADSDLEPGRYHRLESEAARRRIGPARSALSAGGLAGRRAARTRGLDEGGGRAWGQERGGRRGGNGLGRAVLDEELHRPHHLQGVADDRLDRPGRLHLGLRPQGNPDPHDPGGDRAGPALGHPDLPDHLRPLWPLLPTHDEAALRVDRPVSTVAATRWS